MARSPQEWVAELLRVDATTVELCADRVLDNLIGYKPLRVVPYQNEDRASLAAAMIAVAQLYHEGRLGPKP